MRRFIPAFAITLALSPAVPGCASAPPDDPAEEIGAGVDGTSHVARNVLLLVVDPVLASQGGVRLTKYKTWDTPSPAGRAQQLADWLHTASRGRVAYRVVGTQLFDALPVKADGFAYDEAS